MPMPEIAHLAGLYERSDEKLLSSMTHTMPCMPFSIQVDHELL